jgi:hypothetical protein
MESSSDDASKKYPGVDLNLRYFPQEYGDEGETFYRIGAHPDCVGAKSELLPIREVAMMIFMDRLTDKPGWEDKVFNDEIVAKWRHEALTQPEDNLYQQIVTDRNLEPPKPRCRIMTEAAFDYVCPSTSYRILSVVADLLCSALLSSSARPSSLNRPA